MGVEVNSTRKAVEIAWDTSGDGAVTPEPPGGFPEYPVDPGYGIPEGGEHPDHELPQPEQPVDPGYGVDEGTGPVKPTHPIYLPPYIDNSLPGRGSAGGEHPDHELPEIPPDLVGGIPPEQLEKIKDFLLGNLPPFEGGPEYPAPVSDGVEAVQVFAQGQDGDWSNGPVMKNDGLAVLTYPQDFVGESYVEVRALDGNLIDCGTISVK